MDLGTCPHGSKPIRCDICHPESADPCPACSAMKERLTVEGVRGAILRAMRPHHGIINAEEAALAVIAYLEGK